MKTALVHDWLVTHAGAEKALKAIHDLFPGPVHTLVSNGKIAKEWPDVHTSFLQKIPFAATFFRNFLPLFPLAIEQFDLRRFDLILSSSHAVAKGVLTHAHQLHICYCHTPMRYAWDLYHEYLKATKGLKRFYIKSVLHRLRTWDSLSSLRVDHFIANSKHVAKRIKKTYNRDAVVIYPPVATHRFSLSEKCDFYLTVSRLVPYKRVDLLVEAFAHMPQKRLLVVGAGPELASIKKKAGKNVELLGPLSDKETSQLMSSARAFLFASEEDFGITPVEAQIAGTPVIAYGRGGVLETVIEHKTGLFFEEQTVSSIIEAVIHFEKNQDAFCPEIIRSHGLGFNEERFKKEYQSYIHEKLKEFYENRHSSWR